MGQFFFFFAGLFLTVQCFALNAIQVQVDQKIPHGRDVGVGSLLTLKIPGTSGKPSKSVDGIFLGKVVDPSGAFNQFMLLDATHSKVYFADKADVEIGHYSFQPILKPYNQVGGTCTGYAIDHYFQQMYWSGFDRLGQLKEELSTEKGRTQLLVDSINEYYLVLQHRFSLLGVMNKMGSRFGFDCKLKKFTDSAEAISYLEKKLHAGTPVMISFFVGPNMVVSPVSLKEYSGSRKLDQRLWVPRKKGERQSGGHTVVATSLFEFKGRPFLLMLDSDWSEPRVWDVTAYLTEKTAMDELEFVSCK